MNGNWAIDSKDLAKSFGNYTAVQGVSFQLVRGKVMGFLGSNGAGKTTTIRMLCGIIVPTGGSATILGYDVMTETESIKRNIGYMSQKFSLYYDLTIEENIGFYCGIYGMTGEKASMQKQKLMERFELQGRAKQLVQSLSGGWKQRVALACALLHEPQLLVLDEPTAGVDPVSRTAFWDNIHILAKEGLTVLASTHYMDEAEKCDYIGFVFHGRMIAFGTPEELKRQNGMDSLENVFNGYVKKELYNDPRNQGSWKGGLL